jgi:drug/metabolite transporter (DMT)-like permease
LAIVRYSLISGSLAGFFWLMFLSLQTTSTLNTGAIFTTVPGLAGIFGWFLLKERLGWYRIVALILAMVGALWVIFEGAPERLRQLVFNRGDLLFFGACLLMALYMPLVKLFHRGEPMAVMTLWVLITGCGWLLLFSAAKLPFIAWKTVPAIVWFGICYQALFTTIVTTFISQWATLHLGPLRVMAYSYLYPPLVVLIEWGLHRDLPTLRTMIGIAIILPAMLIVQKSGKGTRI